MSWSSVYADWEYRRELTINSNDDLTDYQIKVELNSDNFDFSKAKSDGSDLRFTDSSDNALSYWIESYDSSGETAVVWVKASLTSGDNILYLYYGNSAASSESNGDNTFLFFDDFNAQDTDKWVETVPDGGSISYSDGRVNLYGPSSSSKNTKLVSVNTFTRPYIVDFKASDDSSPSADCYVGFSIPDAPWDVDDWFFAGRTRGASHNPVKTVRGVNSGQTSFGSTFYDDTKVEVVFYGSGGNTVDYSDSDGDSYSGKDISSDSIDSTSKVALFNRNADAQKNFYVDYFFIRQYASTTPSVSVGGENVDLSKFQEHKQITITNNNDDDLTDYQVKIELDSNNFDFDYVNYDGSDIRFVDENNNLLYYWIESFDKTNSQAVIWVKIPLLPANSDTTIYLYYDYQNVSDEVLVPEGLVAWYELNGDAVDSSGNGFDGTNNGAIATTDRFDNTNGAMSFDGSNDYIDCGNDSALNPADAITISVWVKLNSKDIDQEIIRKSRDSSGEVYEIFIKDNNEIFFGIRDSSGTENYVLPSTTLTTGVWHHIVGTYDKQYLRLYLNGDEIGSESSTLTLDSSSKNLSIGYNDAGTKYFNGDIDDVRLYNRALSTDEISTLYHSSSYYNGTNTFGFFDGFDTDDIGTTWTAQGISGFSISNGVLSFNPSENGWGYLVSSYTWDYPMIFEYYAKTTGNYDHHGNFGVFEYYDSTSSNAGGCAVVNANEIGFLGQPSSSLDDSGTSVDSSDFESFKTYKIIETSGTSKSITMVEKPATYNGTKDYSSISKKLAIGSLREKAVYDWVRVRKYASSEPTVSFGNTYVTTISDVIGTTDNLIVSSTFLGYEFSVVKNNNKSFKGCVVSWSDDFTSWLSTNDFVVKVFDGNDWVITNNNDTITFSTDQDEVKVRFVSNTGSEVSVSYDWFKVVLLS